MSNQSIDQRNGKTKVLIVYYSYSGNTHKVANEIQRISGGDMVEIEPLKPYPGNYNAVVEQAKKELHSGFRPELKAGLADISTYDMVFVGSPNWWHTIAPPVMTFLSEADLSGKTVIPFITHGGGGLGRCAADIAELCPNSTVLPGMVVYGADVNAAQRWLAANWSIQ